MIEREQLDDIDEAILALLAENARRTNRDIAPQVQLSAAAVGRRIERLERAGVIEGYTVVLAEDRRDKALEAFTELRVAGNTEIVDVLNSALALPEVREVSTIAGDPDAIVRVRVDTVARLQEVVNTIRRSGQVTSTKTLIILDRWTQPRQVTGTDS